MVAVGRNADTMKLLDRYLLREYLVPVSLCLLAFVMMQFLYDLFHQLPRLLIASTPVPLAATYYLCLLIPTLDYLIPSSLFLATLYALWHLTRHSEIPAMQASGISLPRILVPFLGVGLCFAFVSMAIKEQATPRAREWAAAFSANRCQLPTDRIVRDVPFYNRTDHRIWTIGEFDLDAPNRLLGVKITQEREDGSRAREIRAEKAEWLDGEWWFTNVQVQEFDAADNPTGKRKSPSPGSECVTLERELSETPRDLLISFKDWDFLSSRDMARYLRRHTELSEEAIAQRRFDMHSRRALPWACFIVPLFGVPAGVKGGRQNALNAILLAIAFFFGYYLLTHIGVFLGKRQVVWPWVAAWLSNMVFFAIGSVMVVRMR